MHPFIVGLAIGAFSSKSRHKVGATLAQQRLSFFNQKKAQFMSRFPSNLPANHQQKVNAALNTWLAKIRAGHTSRQAAEQAIAHYKRLKTVGRSQSVVMAFKGLGSMDSMIQAQRASAPKSSPGAKPKPGAAPRGPGGEAGDAFVEEAPPEEQGISENEELIAEMEALAEEDPEAFEQVRANLFPAPTKRPVERPLMDEEQLFA